MEEICESKPGEPRHSIRTEAEYEAALVEIEVLFSAEVGTPAGERLEVLVTLVEAYERKHHPIPPPAPMEMLQYHLESRGLIRGSPKP